MYRRRRPQREKIAFSFDSFLDVVTNVIGIIIRLILVAWVGARSYTALMEQPPAEEPEPIVSFPAPPPRPEPKPGDDPLQGQIAHTQRALDASKSQLLDHLRSLEFEFQQENQLRRQIRLVSLEQQKLDREKQQIDQDYAQRGLEAKHLHASLASLRERGLKLQKEIQALAQQPPQKKVLKYHTPVSRTVRSDEVFFECKQGRVTFIDLPAFLREIREGLRDKAEELRTQWEVVEHTAPVGSFRLKYVIERRKEFLQGNTPQKDANFHYGVSGWTVEPVLPTRGEPLETALLASSEFRALVDHLDPEQSVVTFWVYPDSFALFRRLRDYLYERDIEVAGRPLPPDAPIAASKHGTASRGQ